MRRVGLFLSRLLLGWWVALLCTFAFLLLFNAPTAPDTPFSSVAIAADADTVYLPTRIFDCAETEQQFQCQADIQNRSLVLTWKKGGPSQDDITIRPYPKDCEATYDGKAVGCSSQGMSSVIGNPEQYEVTELGLSTRQFQAVQRRYWGVNTLERSGEPLLMRIGFGLALLGGVSVACFAWFQFAWSESGVLSNLFVSLACGFGMYLFLLSLNFLSDLLPETYEAWQVWNRLTQGGAIAVSVVAMLLALLMLQRGNYRLPKAIASLVGGIGTTALFSYLTLFTLLWLRYAD